MTYTLLQKPWRCKACKHLKDGWLCTKFDKSIGDMNGAKYTMDKCGD